MLYFLARLVLPLFVFSLFLCVSGCEQSSSEGKGKGILGGKSPIASVGVRGAKNVNDGLVPREGGGWNTNRTTVFASRSASVDFDLGKVLEVRALAMMADNNDTYEVLGSLDGRKFERIWLAPRVRAAGLRWRTKKDLSSSTRYIRLSPHRGDASLSIAEVSVFVDEPTILPPRLRVVKASDVHLSYRSALLLAGGAIVLASVFMVQGGALASNLVFLFLALAGVAQAGWAFYQAYPVEKFDVSLTRGVVASVAALLVMREGFSPKRFRPLRWFQFAALGLLALVSIGAFYNLGNPQFFDQKEKKPSVVHNYDMRVYFPVAKYFDELKYDGLYLGSVASYAEEHGGLESAAIQNTSLRDLRDHRMRKLSEMPGRAEEVRSRFSDERWAEFKGDMRYFWETMGPRAYLGSMADHGGNATPVWLTLAYLMYGSVPAGNEVLLWGALLDPLLLLIFAIAVFRAFGTRTALVSLVIFGCNDFYMFGSNWAGATLRNDWMVYMGIGVCALKLERYKTGGAFLAFSALIRAFPAVALIALGVPVLHQLVVSTRQARRFPAWSEIWARHRWFFDTAMGAAVCVALSVLLSSMVMGWDSWPLWVEKISSFTASPHVNHISLLTVIAGSEGNQAEVLAQRSVLFAASVALYFALAIWVAARGAPYRVALLGLMMMPVTMYPANYYMHFIFLLPLLVSEVRVDQKRWPREAGAKTWILLLGICAAQYFTVRETNLSMHFYNASVLLMGGLLAILVVLLPRDEEGQVDFSALPFMQK